MTLMSPAEYRRGEDIAQILEDADVDGVVAAECVVEDAIIEAESEEDLPDIETLADEAAEYAREEILAAPVPSDVRSLRDEVADEEAFEAREGVRGIFEAEVEDAKKSGML